MLQMHTDTINLTMQALQSRSLARLEKTVMPMAENIAHIHDRVNGDLGHKIDDLHAIIMALASSTPSLVIKDRAGEEPGVRSSTISTMLLEPARLSNGNRTLDAPPPRASGNGQASQLPIRAADRDVREPGQSAQYGAPNDARVGREDSAYYSMGPLPFEKDGRRMDWGFESGSPPDPHASIGASHEATPTSPGASSYLASSPKGRRESNLPRRESTTLPHMFAAIDEQEDYEPESSNHAQQRQVSSTSRSNSHRQSNKEAVLPPPALPPDPPAGSQSPATPATFFGTPKRQRSQTSEKRFSRPQTAKSVKAGKGESPQSPNGLEAPSFEKSLFRNAAILCDVRGKMVEYAQHVPDEPDPRYNTEMVAACKEGRICVVRKRENREHGGTKVVTSVWALSDDGTTRLQQKLSDVNETVPYCSYFEPEKVSLPPTEGDIALRFHAEKWGDMLTEEKKTNWVNYFFASEEDAVLFQSAVFGRTLLGSYRTMKTIVIHEGLGKAFAFEEQFANIEMLRLWEDDGISTPGAAGGVLALMHISSNFGEGWARWWINSSKQQVRVRDDPSSGKHARVKGIDVTVVRPGTGASTADKIRSPGTAGEGLQRVDTLAEARPSGRRIKVKKVTGVRIEFKTDEERSKFISAAKKCQERMIPLPEL